jgi:hypothetical protein
MFNLLFYILPVCKYFNVKSVFSSNNLVVFAWVFRLFDPELRRVLNKICFGQFLSIVVYNIVVKVKFFSCWFVNCRSIPPFIWKEVCSLIAYLSIFLVSTQMNIWECIRIIQLCFLVQYSETLRLSLKYWDLKLNLFSRIEWLGVLFEEHIP